MQTLAKEFTELLLLRQNMKLPLDTRHSVGFMLTMRQRDVNIFKNLTRS